MLSDTGPEKRPYCFSLPERSVKNRSDAPPDWCDGCDHFIECQKAYPDRPKILTLHLKEKYFDEIKSGAKIEEYRNGTASSTAGEHQQQGDVRG